jgi:hypothetical protein
MGQVGHIKTEYYKYRGNLRKKGKIWVRVRSGSEMILISPKEILISEKISLSAKFFSLLFFIRCLVLNAERILFDNYLALIRNYLAALSGSN